ncbi:hypothetical protein ACJMK2_034119 [Sinanodonta woodiana]|uniref:C-type lectin domain-containing protein n=1 Tax=Sinanodonta woodiana TaxID=1069815 RepID=A0ABD3WSD9_SINWO
MYFDWDKSLMLNDDVCSKHLYYICQEVPRCRPDYTYVEDLDLCYKIHHESSYNWEQARTVCESEGSDLIVVDNLPLLLFLNRTLDNDVIYKNDEKYWIGATDKVQEGKFIWVNGQQVENNFWHPQEPNDANHNEDCVAIWWYDAERQLGMNDVPCETYTMKFLCQMKW